MQLRDEIRTSRQLFGSPPQVGLARELAGDPRLGPDRALAGWLALCSQPASPLTLLLERPSMLPVP